MPARKPDASDVQRLGQALVDAIQTREKGAQWPLRLEIMDMKSELVAFGPDHVEVFRIKTGGLWL